MPMLRNGVEQAPLSLPGCLCRLPPGTLPMPMHTVRARRPLAHKGLVCETRSTVPFPNSQLVGMYRKADLLWHITQ